MAFTNIDAANFTATAATSIDHFTVYSLDTGGVVLNSGTLGGSATSFSVSNAVFSPGSNYVVTACSSDNTIQGSASFQAGTGAITPLNEIESWQNDTNTIPGAVIAAVVAPNQVAALVQNADRSVTIGTGAYWPQSYTLNVPLGTSFIANQLDHGSNTLLDLFPPPTLPDGITLGIYSQSTCSTNTYYYDSSLGISPSNWYTDASGTTPVDPTTITLPPGAGAFINNPSAAFSLTFVGNPHVPVLPASLPCDFDNINALSCQANIIGTYENITGYSAQKGSQVFIWNGASFQSFTYATVGWIPSVPSVPVGVSVFVKVPRTTTCVPPPSGLVLWLPFDETSGTTSENFAVGGNNGTQIGSPGVSSGEVANSLCFNGSSQWVTVPDYPAIDPGANENFTVDAWVRRSVGAPNSPPSIILDKRDPATGIGYSLAVSYTNLVFQLADSGGFANYTSPGAVPADGNWHFVAVSVNRNQTNGGQFYVDGVAAANFDPTGHPGSLATSAPFQVAASIVGGNQPWDGCIDEVEMFDRALAASEVKGIYYAGSLGKCKPACVTPPSNLALWLPFDETSGTTSANLASPANYGTQVNSPGVVLNAAVNNSLSFNGSQYVTVPDYPAIDIGTNDLTIDAWVNRATNGPNSPPSIIVDKRDINTFAGYSLSLDYGNLIFQISGVNYRDTGTVPPDGRWHFVAVSLSQSTATASFYIDGVLKSVASVTTGNLANTNSLWVGASPLGGNQPWLGDLDEVEVFNRALAASELQSIYHAGKFGKCRPGCVTPPSNLALWLPFDETSGTTSANLASPANFGTQVNSPGVVLNSWVDNSLSFSGSQYVTVPDYPAIEIGTNDLTIDAWINRATNGPDSPPSIIVDKRDINTSVGYSLSLDYGNLIFQISGANYRGSGVVPADGRWHFVAVSLSQSASTASFYIDGVLTSVVPVTPGNLANTSSLWVGASPLGGNQPWIGDLDEVEVFNRALAGTELTAIYTSGQAGKCKPPCFSVSCPTNKTVQCGTKWSFDSPTATSCCSTNITILPTGTVTNGVCPKSITQGWLVSDGCGNSNLCSQTVTLVDTTPPVIICPTNVVIVALNTNCNLVIPLIRPRATDNCTPASQLVYSQSPPAFSIVSGHYQVVTVTVTDLCGNSSVCHVLVEGVDKSGPVLTAPSFVTVTNCQVPCVLNLVTATDNCCPPASLRYTQSPPCNAPLGPGINSVTVTVTDCHGNSTSKKIQLRIIGTETFIGSLTNTGVSNGGGLLLQGVFDPHYSLGPVPAGTPGYLAPTAVAITNLWGWLEFPHISEWIAPDLNQIYSAPSGSYTYTNHFVLPVGANAGSASISGRWAADDGASMYFNGVLQGANTIAVSGSSGFNHWHSFTLNGGFLPNPSVNTILFVVSNSINFNPSPTGLRVEYTNALVNCFTCTPPAIVSITGSRSLPLFSGATFHANAAGTPPLTYQWYFNGAPLANNGHDSGVTSATLHVFPLTFADAGIYTVVVTDPCGSVTNGVPLRVYFGWPWNWGWWNIGQLDNPLAATVGPDLILSGSNTFALTSGTTEDFGLPDPGGQIVNVMDVAPMARGTSIQVPVVAPTGSNSTTSYSVVMDIYEPGAGLGIPSVLFRSGCCFGTNGGGDGVELTLDAQNNIHLDGVAGGVPFDLASPTSLPVDTWNRVALVVDDPQDGVAVNVSIYNNGQALGYLTVPTATGLPINWQNSAPMILSRQTNDAAFNAEFYTASIQFHPVALTPDQIAGSGSPDDGPAAANDTSVGPQPSLSATMAGGNVNLTWTGSPYVLQETTDLTSGVWADSALPFTENEVGGAIVTTAMANPPSQGPSKFYRLVFRP